MLVEQCSGMLNPFVMATMIAKSLAAAYGAGATRMGTLVDLGAYRQKMALQRVFGAWHRRFKEKYALECHLADISNATLFHLAQPGDQSAQAYYELIIGTLDLSTGADFYQLSKTDQMTVVDIHLFLADQVRLELMRRLEWVEQYVCASQPLIQLIMEFETNKQLAKTNPPVLMPSHPEHHHYQQLTHLDREAFIRRLLPEALEAFKKYVL
jgi:hypothetical protein